jgi:hypothetical protein
LVTVESKEKGNAKIREEWPFKNVIYTSIFQMGFPSLIYKCVEGETPLGEALCRWVLKMLTNFKKREKHGSEMTTLQCNHKRGKEDFDHTVIAMQPELHTSHQKASSSPCSGGILDPQNLKILQQT